ncbi:MAG: redoxin domain-containing protein [Gemmatimonadota bacterium]|nr:redoxin domain-containing protein [Gemmatimonadota bacterium]
MPEPSESQPASHWTRIRRIGGRLVLGAIWLFLLVRLAPHLAALVGFETGAGDTPVYTAETLDGRTLTNDSLRGKVVLVNFWATWCLPCRVEMPLLQAMADRHRDAGLVVLGLSRDEGPVDQVRTFLSDRGIRYPVAVVGGETERRFGGLAGYPTSFLLDRTGKIRHQAMGPLAMVSFEPAVRRLLAETSP